MLVDGDCSTVAGPLHGGCWGDAAVAASTACGPGLREVRVCLLSLKDIAELLAFQSIALMSAAGFGQGCETAPAA